MMLSETIYVGGVPVGVARQDTTSKQTTFSPTEIPSKVKPRSWRGIDQLKNAVSAAYKAKLGKSIPTSNAGKQEAFSNG